MAAPGRGDGRRSKPRYYDYSSLLGERPLSTQSRHAEKGASTLSVVMFSRDWVLDFFSARGLLI